MVAVLVTNGDLVSSRAFWRNFRDYQSNIQGTTMPNNLRLSGWSLKDFVALGKTLHCSATITKLVNAWTFQGN